jgi:peptidoglycan/LPS O-acetylase OafA/YrhL
VCAYQLSSFVARNQKITLSPMPHNHQWFSAMAPGSRPSPEKALEGAVPLAKSERVLALDAFRGLCALLVFLAHWNLWCRFHPANDWSALLRIGFDQLDSWYRALIWNTGGCHPGVIGFFVLSGYCIHQTHARLPGTGARPAIRIRRFLFRRSLRIMPVYLYASFLGLAVCLLQSAAPVADPFVQYHSAYTATDLLLRFTSLSSVWPSEVMSGNTILGSVAAEIALYCTYPFVLRAGRLNRWPVLLIGCALLQIAVVRLTPPSHLVWAYNSPMMLALFFYFGAYLAHLRSHRTILFRSAWLSVVAVWLTFILVREGVEFRHRALVLQGLWALCCVCILAGWMGLKGPLHETICRPFVWLGKISYSLYATHSPAIFISTWLLLTLGLKNYLLQLTVALVLTFILTFAGYHFLESPYVKARREGKL